MLKTIDVTDLKPEQIRQIQAMVEELKAKNDLDNITTNQDNSKVIDNIDLTDLFFESEIIQPFNRSMLYGKRA
jgi:hypothetical protein